MSVTSTFAVPIPTPYQSPYYGGNTNIPSGYVGPAVPGNAKPIYGPTYSGAAMYTGGSQSGGSSPITPYVAPQVAGAQTQPQQTQQQTDPNANLNSLVDAMMTRGGYTDRNTATGVAQGNFDSLWNEFMGGNTNQPSEPDFNAGYNDYVAQLDQVLNNLSGQQTSQNTIAQNQYNQGLGSLDLSKTQGQQTFANQRTEAQTNQAKTLKDLSSNLRNSFMAGNIYLGARGAGDSSAANQYSYALTKLGNQQRGDIMTQTSQIMNDINDRETNLNNVYNTEKKNLDTQLSTNLAQVSQWFSEQQNNLALQKGQAAKERSQQVLQYALTQLQTVQTEAANRRQALETWAMNNATTINQLKQNMSQIPGSGYNLPQNTPVAGQPVTDAGGNLNQPSYYGGGGSTQNEKKSLFSNNYLSGAANPTNYWAQQLGG